MFLMSLPDLETFSIAQELACELGLHLQQQSGPKEDFLEGPRTAFVSGLPERLGQLQDLFAVRITQAQLQKQRNLQKLYQAWNATPW